MSERKYSNLQPSFEELQAWALSTWNQNETDQGAYLKWRQAHPERAAAIDADELVLNK